jgi:catechol 2,3-dioxygenase-like lactoylglutathione lyase family enzyme
MPVLNKMIGFLNTNDGAKATAFYRDVLGFRLVRDVRYGSITVLTITLR